VSNLSAKMGINRATLMNYLHYLAEIGLTINLYKETKGNSKLQKPSKIYLENTNLMYILSPYNANVGSVRETFFANQLGNKHYLSYHETADFFVDETYSFEVGGKDKSGTQIKNLKNAFIVSDDIEYGHLNKIPLWLFGFLY
jgi:predicted AAA+ superfamily ATPase